MMEAAIEEMKKSLLEPRGDNKASPLVGVVLVKPDGAIETAHRGELRDGDHAEYTLLERKNRAEKLDGSTLFATLEPCAPGARKPPKLSCAERIVNARIKEIWIGIEDPDPKVDRKGIDYLQRNGVTVNMFHRDLQEIIREVNKDFIEQAMERAAAVREEKKPMVATLSSLEKAVPRTDVTMFSFETLEQYRTSAQIKEAVDSNEFRARLLQLGLFEESKTSIAVTPTGFGLLLFGKEPRLALPQAGLLATIHYPDGTEETKDFDGPQVLAPGQALAWLKDKIPNPIDRTQAQRREVNETLYQLVREGIVNALVHRDYDIRGAKCQLVISPGKIEVRSPGEPVSPITLEQLQSFSAPMLSRNPMLHYVFAKMKLAEERGLGLKSMREAATKAGLPLPKYSWENPYLTLTFYRSTEAAAKEISSDRLSSLNRDERKGLEFIITKGLVTRKEYADAMGFDDRKSQRHLKRFSELGLLEKIGASSTTKYKVRET